MAECEVTVQFETFWQDRHKSIKNILYIIQFYACNWQQWNSIILLKYKFLQFAFNCIIYFLWYFLENGKIILEVPTTKVLYMYFQ